MVTPPRLPGVVPQRRADTESTVIFTVTASDR